MVRRSVLGMCFLFLTACGFHLRGAADLPFWLTEVAISCEQEARALEIALTDQLTHYHIPVISESTNADHTLIIEESRFSEQISSISSSTTPRQYQLIYTVRFKLVDKQGKIRIPSNKFLITRQVTLNSDRILGSDDEVFITKQEMIQRAASQVLTRLGKK